MKKGAIVHGSLFSLRFLKNLPERDLVERAGPLNTTHFSVVVAKKVAKTAVSRNKIRRRCYSILKKVQESLNNYYFIILFAKKGVEKATFAEVRADIEKLATKL